MLGLFNVKYELKKADSSFVTFIHIPWQKKFSDNHVQNIVGLSAMNTPLPFTMLKSAAAVPFGGVSRPANTRTTLSMGSGEK